MLAVDGAPKISDIRPDRSALLGSQLPCAVIDPTANIVAVSRALSSDFVGSTLTASLDINEDELATQLETTDSTPLPGAYRRRDNGVIVPVFVHLLPPSNDGSRLAILMDGTPFRMAEDARFGSAPYPLMRATPEGRLVYANHAAERLLHREGGALLESDLFDHLPPEAHDDVRAAFTHCVRDKQAAALSLPRFKPEVTDGGAAQEVDARLYLTPDFGPGERVLGAIAMFQPLVAERARARIVETMMAAAVWRAAAEAMMKIVVELVPCDRAMLAVYAEEGARSRIVLEHPPRKPEEKWPRRWIELSHKLRDWVSREIRTEADIECFLEDNPEIPTDVVQFVAGDISSFATVPAGIGRGLVASLTLSASRRAAFGREEVETLRQLDLAPVLANLAKLIEDERDAAVVRIGSSIERCGSIDEAGRVMLEGLVVSFGWDHAALYVVNHRAGHFELLSQYPRVDTEGRPHRLAMRDGYSQTLDKGMLGTYLAEASQDLLRGRGPGTLTCNDAINKPEHNIITADRNQRSALTIAVRLDGVIRWLIDVAAFDADVFHGPDRDAVREAVDRLEIILKPLAAAQINQTLLGLVREGVVVAASDGTIRSANAAAQDMIGLMSGAPGGKLQDCAANADSVRVIERAVPSTAKRVVFRGDGTRERVAVATCHGVVGGDNVWLLTDAQAADLPFDINYMRATAQVVAEQARPALALAGTLARNLVRIAADPAARERVVGLVKQLTAEIGKADITYERLAEVGAVKRLPLRERRRFDLQASVERTLEDLPEADRKFIDSRLGRKPATVEGDEGRLRQVVRWVIGHLLTRRPERGKVVVRLRQQDTYTLRLTLGIPRNKWPETPEEPVSNAGQDRALLTTLAARDGAGLGIDLIRTVIEGHGGTLETDGPPAPADNPAPHELMFDITLPRSMT